MKPFLPILLATTSLASAAEPKMSGNPVFEGHYADPEVSVFGDTYWIFPTYSDRFPKQLFFDAFSSKDLTEWTKHERIVTNEQIQWADEAMWAPCCVEKDGRYYFFFGANNIKSNDEVGGIGIAVADAPGGPYKDYLGKPLVGEIHNGAQPIDQFVFQDEDGARYLIYGGWGVCNIAKLNDDFTGFIPFADGTTFRDITPHEDYVEGPVMFIRDGRYYFMWSEGKWGGPDYRVAYGIADSPFGPFERLGTVLQQDPEIATGAGHHSVLNIPGTDRWFAIYHRRPKGETDRDARVTCIDEMRFAGNGHILPIKLTREGVPAQPLPAVKER